MTTTQNPTAPLASVLTATMSAGPTPIADVQTEAVALHISPMADTLASYNRSAAVVVDKSDLFTLLRALDDLAENEGGYQSRDAGRMAADLRYGMTVAGILG